MLYVALLGALLHPFPMNIECSRDESQLDRARNLYLAGLEDAEQGRWVQAEREFRESYSISCASASLFNLTAVLTSLGRLIESRDAVEQLLEDEELSDELRAQAEERLRTTRQAIATLLLVGLSPEPHELVLDGEAMEDGGGRPVRIGVDPRPHSLLIRREGFEPFTWRGDFEPGAVREVEVELVPRASAEGGDGDAVIWAVIGASGGAVLVGVAITIAVVLATAGPGLPPHYEVLRP